MFCRALALGAAVFVVSWCAHAVLWRIRRPAGYLVWLPILFVVLPGAAAAAARPPRTWGAVAWAAALIHLGLSVCYTLQYAGIIEYSPSAEVLKFVRSRMPGGVPQAEIDAPTLTEEVLTDKRVDHLLSSLMVVRDGEALSLSAVGRFAVGACAAYRRLLGLPSAGKG